MARRSPFADCTEEDVEIFWKYGAPEELGPYPGRALAILAMCRAVTARGRRFLGELFASLSPRSRVVALVALVRRIVGPAAMPPAVGARPVRRLVSQAGHGALAPVRGSPGAGAHLAALPVTRPPT